jgi:hypothetical protein
MPGVTMSTSHSLHPTTRAAIEPKLVDLIAGLRRHQVSEAVQILLDYVDSRSYDAAHATTALEAIKQKLYELHLALDRREHHGSASGKFIADVEVILSRPWIPGQALQKLQGAQT